MEIAYATDNEGKREARTRMPTLYVVATPIGNLGDFSPRAVETLKNVALIAAEDTRVTQKLLAAFDIHTPLTSCHEHNERSKAEQIVQRMLAEGIDVAVTTDAGTPCISDPGRLLVAEAVKNGIPVLAVAGPTAMAAALSVSGMPVEEFTFYGFLPRQKGELKAKLADMARRSKLGVAHESPHRVIDLLAAVLETLPHTRVSASCDLTKLHEKTIRGTAEEVLAMLRANEKAEKGEYCLVLDLHDVRVAEKKTASDASLEARIFEQLMAGRDMREAGDALMEQGEKRNDVYRARTAVQKFLEELLEEDDDE